MSGVFESPRARCDVLVSHFRADDFARQAGHDRPVSRLASTLETLLRRKLADPDLVVSTEHPLISEQSTGSGLIAQLDECRTLVLAVTPTYLRTHWMREGLKRLIAGAKGETPQVQVVLAEMVRTDRSEWPVIALGLPAVRLYAPQAPVAAEALPVEPDPEAEERAFFGGATELAHLVLEQLRADRSRSSSRATVLVADPTDDVREAHARVVAALRQRNDFAVVSTRRAAGVGADPDAALRTAMQSAVAFVQVLGAAPDAERRAITDAVLAREVQAEQALPIVQWRPGSPDSVVADDEAWREIVADPRVRSGGMVPFLRELGRTLDRAPKRASRSRRSSVIERFASIATPAVPGNGEAAARRALAGVFGARRGADEANGSKVVQVFVQAAAADRESAREVGRQLRYLGIAPVIAPEPNADATFLRNLEAHDAALRSCQGFILVCGQAPEPAVRANLQFLLRSRGSWPGAVRAAILDVEPDRDRAFADLPPGVLLIDCPGELHSDVLKPFIEDLKALAHGDVHA